MTERTYKIIMACKSHECCNVSDAVKEYMSKECMTPISHYDELTMSNIMLTAVYDYLDSCDRPSSLLRELEHVWKGEYLSISERIARAFLTVMVRNRDGQYVNGFGEWAEREAKQV